MRLRACAALLAGLVVGACAPTAGASPASPSQAVELLVFGATSLRGALEEAAAIYEAASPGMTIAIATDSSATLATQIEEGAPADVFLSADTTNPARLADAGLTAGDPVPFAGNGLAVVVPAGNPGQLGSPADLARPGLRVIAVGEGVPITRYAEELVANLAAEPGYPAGFAEGYAANIASREDNVAAVLAKLELGEGDAGIVYTTDAAASDRVEALEIPAGAEVSATYAGVALRGSAHPGAAAAFLAWLAGPGGRAVLEPLGFGPAP